MALPRHRPVRRDTGAPHAASLWGVAALALGLLLLASGCANIRTGEAEIPGVAKFGIPALPRSGNVVEIFNEMHYQPSYKVQEGPRILPPPDSVPLTGKELTYASLEEYGTLDVPSRVRDAYDEEEAGEIYRVNCLACHGGGLQGDGPISKLIKRGPMPADLTGDIVIGSTDGEVFAFISNGGRQGYAAILRGRQSASPMPRYLPLLTEEERWMLVMYVRSKQ